MKKITVIEWVDSSVQNHQVDGREFPKPVTVRSTGFIVEETGTYIVLARDDMGDGDFRGLCCILKVLIMDQTNREDP